MALGGRAAFALIARVVWVDRFRLAHPVLESIRTVESFARLCTPCSEWNSSDVAARSADWAQRQRNKCFFLSFYTDIPDFYLTRLSTFPFLTSCAYMKESREKRLGIEKTSATFIDARLNAQVLNAQ